MSLTSLTAEITAQDTLHYPSRHYVTAMCPSCAETRIVIASFRYEGAYNYVDLLGIFTSQPTLQPARPKRRIEVCQCTPTPEGFRSSRLPKQITSPPTPSHYRPNSPLIKGCADQPIRQIHRVVRRRDDRRILPKRVLLPVARRAELHGNIGGRAAVVAHGVAGD